MGEPPAEAHTHSQPQRASRWSNVQGVNLTPHEPIFHPPNFENRAENAPPVHPHIFGPGQNHRGGEVPLDQLPTEEYLFEE